MKSIRSKVVLLFIPLIIIPLLIGGIAGLLYFQDVIKHNIWDHNMGQAETVSEFTSSYVNLSENYLTSIADRPLVIKAVEERNRSFLDETVVYTANQSFAFDSAVITDDSGKVIAYHTQYQDRANRSYGDIIGKNLGDRPYVREILKTSRPVAVATRNDIDGSSTIYVGVPIRGPDQTAIGTIIGIYDMDNFTSTVVRTAADSPYIYLVNRSGNVIVHSNNSYMSSAADFSQLPAVQNVIAGKSGVIDQYNPIENDYRLTAYYPVNSTGWGVVVSVPTSTVYRPVTDAFWAIAAMTLVLALASLSLAFAFSRSITDPIMGLYGAARAISGRSEYREYLPLERDDEIGQVAVCMDRMAKHIGEDRERITSERDRAALYLDIMGHDINNLNQVSIGNLELIRDDANLTPAQREAIDDAFNASLGSAGIINNVRKIQAINENKETFRPEDVDDMLRECIRDVPRPRGRAVTINYSPRKGLMVNGPELLKEVFCNVINNAVKHSEGDVTVDVAVSGVDRAGKTFYDVSIADNGPGIPEALKPKLFGRFQRGDTKAHGKGLGLFIARSLVESIGGEIRAEDRVPGDPSKGARFIISLPAAEGER